MLQIYHFKLVCFKTIHLKPFSLAWSHDHSGGERTPGLQSHHIQFWNETRLILQSCGHTPWLAGDGAGQGSALVVPVPFAARRAPRILPAVSHISSRCPQRPLNPGNGSAPSEAKGSRSSLAPARNRIAQRKPPAGADEWGKTNSLA